MSKNSASLAENNLIRMLKTFSEQEMMKFRKFINSPYFSKGRNVINLYEAIKQFYPDFNSKELTKEIIFSKTFPKKEYNDNVLRKQISVLKQLADDFLVQLYSEREKKYYKLNLISEYGNRFIQKLFDDNINEIESELKTVVWEDEKYFHDNLILNDIKTSSINEIPVILDSIVKASEYLTDYFLIKKLRYLYQIILLSGREHEKSINEFMDELKYFIEVKKYDLKPSAKIYYNIITAVLSESTKHYYNAKKMIMNSFDLFDKHHQMVFLVALQNIAINGINKGLNEFRKEWKEIFLKQFSNGLLYDSTDETISHTNFRNIVLLGLRVGETELIEKFINYHYKRIKGESGESMYNFSMAHLAFNREEFNKAIEFSSKVNFDLLGGSKNNYAFYLDIKKLLLMCFYELDFYDEAISVMDSLRHYLIKSAKIPDIIITQHKNFLRFYNILIRFKLKEDRNLKLDEEQVISCKLVSKKDWLLDKFKKYS